MDVQVGSLPTDSSVKALVEFLSHPHMMCTTNFHSVTRWAQAYDEDYRTSQHLQVLGIAHLTPTSVKSMFLAATSKWKYVILAVSMFGFPDPLNILSFCCILDDKKKNDKVSYISVIEMLRKSHGESMSCDQEWCRSKQRADSFRMLS